MIIILLIVHVHAGSPSQSIVTSEGPPDAEQPVSSQLRKLKSLADLMSAAPKRLRWNVKGERRTEPVTEGPLAELAFAAAGIKRSAAKVIS